MWSARRKDRPYTAPRAARLRLAELRADEQKMARAADVVEARSRALDALEIPDLYPGLQRLALLSNPSASERLLALMLREALRRKKLRADELDRWTPARIPTIRQAAHDLKCLSYVSSSQRTDEGRRHEAWILACLTARGVSPARIGRWQTEAARLDTPFRGFVRLGASVAVAAAIAGAFYIPFF